MRIVEVNGNEYRLPNSLNEFQQRLFIHLINWKWEHITRDPGLDGGIEYDAIIPEELHNQLPMIYPAISDTLRNHAFPFRQHRFFHHMVSSQAACINLFLPILTSPSADQVLQQIKPDLASLDREQLDNGYRIEFWDEPHGNLGDKTRTTGTDSDIAIAYRNHDDQQCLWLIENKLRESEFTDCGGARSKGRTEHHHCDLGLGKILQNKSVCYYHSASQYAYWDITEKHKEFFAHHDQFEQCPFKGGMNQLWRNQLLGLSIEQDDRQPFQEVYFSVAKHPENHFLDATIRDYETLVGPTPKFSSLTSRDILMAARDLDDEELNRWVNWYDEAYAVAEIRL